MSTRSPSTTTVRLSDSKISLCEASALLVSVSFWSGSVHLPCKPSHTATSVALTYSSWPTRSETRGPPADLAETTADPGRTGVERTGPLAASTQLTKRHPSV